MSKTGPEKKTAGFSLVELLVTVGIAAGVIAVAAVVFGAISTAKSSKSSGFNITLGNATAIALFGQDLGGLPIRVWSAPNYTRAAEAEAMRDVLLSDISSASAIFVLARSDNTTYRPANATISLSGNFTAPDTPEAFRQFLANIDAASSPVFTAYRGTPDSTTARNFSMFVLRPSGTANTLQIHSVYELDFVETASPSGTYAAFRRFAGNPLVLTGYYDIFYSQESFLPSDSNLAPFFPAVAAFERRVRAAAVEGNPADALKRARNRPFYFVWLPDPAARSLYVPANTTSFTQSDPRFYYASMGNRTSFFFVIPMFPSL